MSAGRSTSGTTSELAEEKLDANAHAYFAGGAGDEVTLRDNLAAFERRKLRPRVLVDVSSVSTATTVLGTEVALPILIAPLAMQRMAHPDGELATARAAAAAGTIMCLSTAATARPAEVAAAAPGAPRWFQVYVFGDRSQTEDADRRGSRERLLRARAHGRHAVPRAARARPSRRLQGSRSTHVAGRHLRRAVRRTRVSWRDLEWLAGYGLPVVVKGILTAEDARLACEHGAAAVVVSNHGGRQLDGVSATLDVLEEVVEAVDGRAEVLLDGGVRRGTDVLKALALGARAVLIGRAMLWGLAVARRGGRRATCSQLLRDGGRARPGALGCASPATSPRRRDLVVHACDELAAAHDSSRRCRRAGPRSPRRSGRAPCRRARRRSPRCRRR